MRAARPGLSAASRARLLLDRDARRERFPRATIGLAVAFSFFLLASAALEEQVQEMVRQRLPTIIGGAANIRFQNLQDSHCFA